MKKNYDEVSTHVANNAIEMEKVKVMRESYDKRIADLISSKLASETELKETKEKFDECKHKQKESIKKIKGLEKDI